MADKGGDDSEKDAGGKLGGCEVLEDLSDAQIGGLAGGETLRREMLAFSKASKRAVSKLQEALCTPSTAIPILALVAQRHFGVNKVCLCRSCEFLQAARVQSLQREGKSCKAAWATL